jgi:hypothetical protein
MLIKKTLIQYHQKKKEMQKYEKQRNMTPQKENNTIVNDLMTLKWKKSQKITQKNGDRDEKLN